MAEDKKQPPQPQPVKPSPSTEEFRESNTRDGKFIVTPRVPLPSPPPPPRNK